MARVTRAPSDRDVQDFMYLLDTLRDELSSGSRLPFAQRTLIDQEDCLRIVEQLRATLPQELDKARAVLEERDRILDDAEVEANERLTEVKAQVRRLTDEHQITRAARVKAVEIEEQAEARSRQIRKEADDYVRDLLREARQRIEQSIKNLSASLTTLDNGRAIMDADPEPARQPGQRRRVNAAG
jgi:hypothetical protein